MSLKLQPPKKKRRVRGVKCSPFPVPIASLTLSPAGPETWLYYTGVFNGMAVIIKHTGDINYLYNKGFFGKGNLSRAQPNLKHHCRVIAPPEPSMTPLKVMSRRQYIRHLNWSKMAAEGHTLPAESNEYDSSEEVDVKPDLVTASKSGLFTTDKQIDDSIGISRQGDDDAMDGSGDGPGTNQDKCFGASCSQDSNYVMSVTGDKADVSMLNQSSEHNVYVVSHSDWDQEADDSFWSTNKKEDLIVSSGVASAVNDLAEHDWIKPSINNSESEKQSDDIWQEDADFWAVDTTPSLNSNTEDTTNKVTFTNLKEISTDNLNSCTSNLSATDQIQGVVDDSTSLVVNDRLRVSENKESANSCLGIEATSVGSTVQGQSNLMRQQNCQDLHEKHRQNECHSQLDENNKRLQQSSCQQICKSTNTFINSKTLDLTGSTVEEMGITMDPLCQKHEEDGHVLVVSDSEPEVLEDSTSQKKSLKWTPVIKKEPFPVNEHLELSLEEAFFLSYGLGCLCVYTSDQKVMNLIDMWRAFYKAQSTFLASYIAYHYFRSLGWVVRCGMKFGAQYSLYKKGPPFYHASYSVIIRMVDSDSLQEILDTEGCHGNQFLDWGALFGINRATENVAKEILLCYVLKPPHLSKEDILSPKCIPEFKVKVLLLRRWVSSQERERRELEEIL